MLTVNKTEAAMSSLRSPADLCDRLGMRPTTYQLDLLDRFYNDENPLQAKEIPAEHTSNAAAICALWRTMLTPGSKCVIIAANRELESRFMGFLYEVTTTIDPAMSSSCSWKGPKLLKFGTDAGWELRFVSNKPEQLAKVRGEVVTWVVLGARSSEPKFNDARKQVESNMDFDGHRHIIIW
jgi:hypothetical protein